METWSNGHKQKTQVWEYCVIVQRRFSWMLISFKSFLTLSCQEYLYIYFIHRAFVLLISLTHMVWEIFTHQETIYLAYLTSPFYSIPLIFWKKLSILITNTIINTIKITKVRVIVTAVIITTSVITIFSFFFTRI